MRPAVIVAIAISAAACGGGNPTSPTSSLPVSHAPEPPPPAPVPAPEPALTGILWVMVFPGISDICLPDATVEVIADGHVIQSGRQQTPCSYWDYGADEGILFEHLPVVPLTLRASAPGYVTGEITVTPTVGWYSVTAIGLQRAATALPAQRSASPLVK
jgi:hypothetical protein